MCDRFFIVAFVKLIAAFVNAFAIWPRKKKKKKTIVAFLKRGYSQIQKNIQGVVAAFKTRLKYVFEVVNKGPMTALFQMRPKTRTYGHV